jgi:uncharacterized protein (TIGR02271 family)
MADKDRENKNQGRDKNRDPITDEPGSHPVGTGVGAAAGGVAGAAGAAAAGAATGTAVGGPVGMAAGAAIGAVAGGLVGKGVAEKVDPTREDEYWRGQYQREPYYEQAYTYEDYRGAYRTGYEGYGRWGAGGRSYEEAEPDLRREYERNYGKSRLSWDKARRATRAAWYRFDRDLSKYIGYDVVDRNLSKIGTLECLWSDHNGEPAFIGVRTGWIFGKNHVVPANDAQVNEQGQRIRLPYDRDKVKDAPAYDADAEMSPEKEREVYRYYGVAEPTQQRAQPRAAMAQPSKSASEQASIKLSEEELKVGKRQVEAGGVRLRKVIRTETVNQPVQLSREEIVIERVPATEARTMGERAFEGEEIYIPLRREEAVVQKEAHVREEVRVRKEKQTEQQQVSEQVRREDVEIEESGEARRTDKTRPTPAEEIREREEIPRSQRRRE